MTAIYAALAAVMADCDHVAKRDTNDQQRFRFRGIDTVLNAVGPILRKHQVLSIPTVLDCRYDAVQTSTGKNATACRVRVRYDFYATDGSSVPAEVVAEAWDWGDKAAPKAMSVAFRTALIQALALPTDDPDPDSQTFEQAKSSRPATSGGEGTRRMSRRPAPETGEAITDAQRGAIFGAFTAAGFDTDAKSPEGKAARLHYISQAVGRTVESTNDLTKREASTVLDMLKADAARRAVPVEDPPEVDQ